MLRLPCLTAALVAALPIIQPSAQEISSSAEADEMREPTDEILARRMLMTGINRNMDEILYMIAAPEERLDPDEAVEHASTISIMLMAFPHLYSPDTDIYSEELEAEEAGLVSLSRPKVWDEYDAFYARSKEAANLAYAMERSSSVEEFVANAERLEEACNSCHVTYRRYVDPEDPVPDVIGSAPSAEEGPD